MKALSVRQPWAALITNGFKDIENRQWFTKYRGEILIHAPMKIDIEGYNFLVEDHVFIMPPLDELEVGGIIGKCEIVDCVTESDSDWFEGKYGFVLKNAKILPFMPCKGKLGFFEVDYNIKKAKFPKKA